MRASLLGTVLLEGRGMRRKWNSYSNLSNFISQEWFCLGVCTSHNAFDKYSPAKTGICEEVAFSTGIHSWVYAEQTSLPLSQGRYREASKRLGEILGEKMTHSDCASVGQCKLDRVEKSKRAVGFIAKYKSMTFSCVVLCIVLECGCTACFIKEFTKTM